MTPRPNPNQSVSENPQSEAFGSTGVEINHTLQNGVTLEYFENNDIYEHLNEVVSEGAFASFGETADGTLDGFYTSSVQFALSSSNYYIQCYDQEYDNTAAQVVFDVSYGNLYGYTPGADTDDYSYTYNPAKAIYYQARNLILPTSSLAFEYADDTTGSGDFFMLSFKRNRFKNALTKKRWQLSISASGDNRITLIDNGSQTSPSQPTVGSGVGSAYYVCSGSIEDGVYGTIADNPYGLYYPELGLIMINSSASMAFLGETDDYSASAVHTEASEVTGKFVDLLASGSDFQAQNNENVSSTIYYVRARANQFNFSNNPTWQSGSNTGVILHEEMWYNPITYITTIGLYDDSNNLLAVAKTSQPIKKNFEEEYLFKVKLKY